MMKVEIETDEPPRKYKVMTKKSGQGQITLPASWTGRRVAVIVLPEAVTSPGDTQKPKKEKK